MSERQVAGILMASAALFGNLLGEYTRRRRSQPLGAFDYFGFFLLLTAVGVGFGWW